MMSFRKVLIIAAAAAAIGDTIAMICLTRVGPDGPQAVAWIGFVLLYPAIRLSGFELGSVGLMLAGFIQLFVVSWFIVIVGVLLLYGRRSG